MHAVRDRSEDTEGVDVQSGEEFETQHNLPWTLWYGCDHMILCFSDCVWLALWFVLFTTVIYLLQNMFISI